LRAALVFSASTLLSLLEKTLIAARDCYRVWLMHSQLRGTTMSDRDTEAVYERAGLGHSGRRGVRPAVVVVDLSCGFTQAQHPTGSDLTAEVEATGRVVEIAHDRGLPVVYTTIAFDPESGDGGAWLVKWPGLAVLRAGTPLVELDPRLPRRPTDTVIVKKGASAFFGTNLVSVLVARGADTVVLCGATTSGCIRASAVDSVQNGFPTLVVREAVGDRAPGPHEANLFDIDAKYADVISLEEALAYLAGVPAADSAVRA
jgi:maleamate amidohydrolase